MISVVKDRFYFLTLIRTVTILNILHLDRIFNRCVQSIITQLLSSLESFSTVFALYSINNLVFELSTVINIHETVFFERLVAT